MRVGHAAAAITPPLGASLAGFAARTEPARGVHDDLSVRAIVLDDDRARAALVILDLCEIDAQWVARVRGRVEAAAGLPGEAVIVAATHTHAAPATFGLLSAPPDPQWLEQVERAAASAAADACADLVPAALALGRGEARSVGRNRRRPDGPTDPTVTMLRCERTAASPVSLVHYACHPTVLGPDNLLISRDFPGFTVDAVERATGGRSVFANGACGDINAGHSAGRTALGLPTPGRTFDRAEALGLRVAVEAIAAFRNARPVHGRLSARRRTITVPLRQITATQARAGVAEHRRRVDAAAAAGAGDEALTGERLELFYAEAALQWAEGCQGPSETAEIQGIAIGDLALMALPGEFFAESGARLRGRSPFSSTVVIGYANGCLGYVPPASAFEEGGYETRLAPWSRVAPGAEAVILDAAAGVLEDLRGAAAA
jgi:neutral ceramidase